MQAASVLSAEPLPAAPATGKRGILVEDLEVAAYLLVHGLQMVSASAGSRGVWGIRVANPNPEDPAAGESVLRRLRMAYADSDFHLFTVKIKQIRSIASRAQGKPGRPGALPDGRYQVGDLGLAAWMLLSRETCLSEVRRHGPSWAVIFENPYPDDKKAGLSLLKRLRMHYPNTRYADFDGKTRAIRKAAFGD